MPSRLFWLRVFSALAFLAVADGAYRARVRASFIPERTFAAAVTAGKGCVATLGDSRMVAGIVPATFERELQKIDTKLCHAGLAIGGGGVAAQYMALRRYLEENTEPRLVVLGTTVEATLYEAAGPETFIGNQAVVLGWSKASDVTWLYPGFPAEHFDSGFRFLTQRAVALSAFGSIAWARVQALQDRLVGSAGGDRNRFGLVADMEALARTMERDVAERIRGYPERAPFHPAFLGFLDLARERRVPVLVVEMPMPSVYRAALARASQAPTVRATLVREVERRGGRVVDLGHPDWLEDSAFDDPLHLGAAGAERFTRDVAAAVRAGFAPM